MASGIGGCPGRCGFCQLVPGADDVDDHRLAAPQVRQLPRDHLRRTADQRRVIQPDHDTGLKGAVGQPGLEQPLVERHGPLHPFDTADAEELGVL